MIQDVFRDQIDFYKQITQDVLDNADFKTVWSGKRLVVGDKILYALVYVKGTDDLKLISFLERELDEIATSFNFVKYQYEDDPMGLPILSFSDDIKRRV